MFEKRKIILREQENPEQSKRDTQLQKIRAFLLKKTIRFHNYRQSSTEQPESEIGFSDIFLKPTNDGKTVVIALVNKEEYAMRYGEEENVKEALAQHCAYFGLDAVCRVVDNKETFDSMVRLYQTGDFTITIDNDDVHRYIECGRDFSETSIEQYLSGDYLDSWQDSGYEQWEYYIDHLNPQNLKAIKAYVKKTITKDVLEDHDMKSLRGMSLTEIFTEFNDELETARNIMNWSIEDGDREDYVDNVVKCIISAMEHYGHVKNNWSEGMIVQGNLHKLFDDAGNLLELIDKCDADVKCIILEGVEYYIDKPRLGYDSRYQPSCDYKVFNDFLHDRLDELN
jgi:hypothetical protein